MNVLPPFLCSTAGLAVDKTPQDLLDHISAGHQDILDGLLTSEESRIAAASSLVQLPKYSLRIEDQVGTLQHRYCELQVDNHTDPIRVGLIGEQDAEVLPTELENLIFWAIIDPSLSWHQAKRTVGGQDIVNWRHLAKGKAIVAEPTRLEMGLAGRQIISALFGLSHSDILPPSLPAPLLSASTLVKLNAKMDNFSSIQARLLFEASSIQHPKWRFLSLYRILENAYLANIKSALLSDFDHDASKAVENAKSKLASEVNQLVALAENADLKTEFEAFSHEIDSQIKVPNPNNYLIRLDRSMENEPLYKAVEPYKKGVLRFYKIRCSIAHAGTSSVIYEQFHDANAATIALLPSVETIALKSLKITA